MRDDIKLFLIMGIVFLMFLVPVIFWDVENQQSQVVIIKVVKITEVFDHGYLVRKYIISFDNYCTTITENPNLYEVNQTYILQVTNGQSLLKPNSSLDLYFRGSEQETGSILSVTHEVVGS